MFSTKAKNFYTLPPLKTKLNFTKKLFSNFGCCEWERVKMPAKGFTFEPNYFLTREWNSLE